MSERIATIALPRWGRLALLLLLPALALGALSTAAARAAVPTAGAGAPQASAGEEEVEEDEEEEIEVEFEYEEGEEEESATLPPECLLRTVRPSVLARFSHGDLRLDLHYTAETATPARVAYWLKGTKGSARLGSANRHLGRHGVLEMARHLDPRTAAKLEAARVIVVQLDVPGTPRLCKRYLTMRLTAQRFLGRSATWSEPTY